MDRAFSPPSEPGALPQSGIEWAVGPYEIAGRSQTDAVIPPLPLLFQTNACSRSTERDWVDLHVLMTQHGFTMDDFGAAYEATGSKSQLDIAFNRLTSGQPRAGDPGVAGLLEHPPSVEELAEYFRRAIRDWKRAEATKALRS